MKILFGFTCPGDQRGSLSRPTKDALFQSTCQLCRESHKTQKSDAMLYAPSLNEVELVGIFSEQQLAGTQPACTIAAPHSLSLTRLNASRPCGHQRPPRRQTEPLQCQPEQIMETSLQPSVTRAQPDIPAQPLQFEPSNSTTTICEPPAASHSGLTVKTCR
ncbi:uncharacterized protein LOC114475878 isoform X5 [Gouania willdenowi]|uniref:uncharacterized protein LOC114475878 isoform X5 n=1 Tax=Gouania willdenowi TaxID=441366 RepID=UPI00105594C8|nr:uncharacterized protein LOC114475878 isoform X5 [Gouania willdenowi]